MHLSVRGGLQGSEAGLGFGVHSVGAPAGHGLTRAQHVKSIRLGLQTIYKLGCVSPPHWRQQSAACGAKVVMGPGEPWEAGSQVAGAWEGKVI